MLHFIPAWYQAKQWCENEQSWLERQTHTEFDDTVKHIQLFHRSGTCPYQIVLLSYAPNFRHFLHRQGVYRAPYWSCFDAIQEVKRKRAAVFSFHHLKWPKEIEFIYTPFVVVAMMQKEKYAQIDFGVDGNLIRVDMFKDGRVCRRNIYDDRGFISSTILYENGQPAYQDYLMENGVWKLRHFIKEGYVEINQGCSEYLLQYQGQEYTRHFSQMVYDSMEQVIHEVFMSYISLTDSRDIFCVAMHEQHIGILLNSLKKKKLILSFFYNRPLNLERLETILIIKSADYIISDSKENLKKLQKRFGGAMKNAMAIPPYDSRLDSGLSMQFDVQKILVVVDGIKEEEFNILIHLLGEYLFENENVCICLFTRKADEYDRKQKILNRVRRELEKAGLEEGWAAEINHRDISENHLDPEENVPVRFFVEQCVNELEVSRCMREQRLLVDLREIPEIYLQITAISIGIPQVVRTRTEFVQHEKNGMILKEIQMLPQILHYYLDGMKNWNEARVYSYELMKDYTTDKLLEKWKEVMNSVGGNSNLTVGESGLEYHI